MVVERPGNFALVNTIGSVPEKFQKHGYSVVADFQYLQEHSNAVQAGLHHIP